MTNQSERPASSHSATTFGYSPALDGLRAFAVASVVLFHAGVSGLGGGFLGVDAFFVLSGFLITSLLLAEHLRTGHIRLSKFWARRARRLLPALLVMLLATAIAGHYLLDSGDLSLLRGDGLSALFYVANWRMIYRGTGYVAATSTPSPLQHTWSLGIEEQFYLIWPLIVAVLIAWLAARRTRWVLLAFCVVGTAVSALLAADFFSPDSISRSYYGTDTRAEALLIGAALAAILSPVSNRPAPKHRGQSRHVVLGLLALAGAAITVWMWHFALDTDSWMYHGGLALIAIATGLIIVHAVVSPTSPTARLLAIAPLVWLGRISYGVYLWHWPLFEYVTADRTGLSRWPLLAVRLAGTLTIAIVSFYLIEQPIRRGALTRLVQRRLPRRAPIGVTVLGVSAAAFAVVFMTAPPPPSSLSAAPVVITSTKPRPSSSATGVYVPMDRADRTKGTSGTEPRVTFFGDSVSWVIGTYLPKHPGLWTSVRAIEGCGIATLPDILELGSPHTNYPGCTNWPARWQKGVKADDPDVAVIELNRWELMDRKLDGVYQHVGEPAYNAYLLGQLDKAVTIAGSRGAAVVLLTAAYTHRAEKPDGSLYPEDDPARVNAWNQLLVQEQAKHPRTVTILNLNKLVCPDGKFTWDIGSLRIRSDGLHYTPAGVQKIIAPWLLPKLAAIADGTYKA
ncbi:MAG TPA: acyltransferase family protein [Micromonosporaceae bacterium]|nr:acyltransferase family protein [Micromonosporaceae bacterium]